MLTRYEDPWTPMMATVATHKLGDISADVPTLCAVHGEDDDNYIGQWAEGFGFANVKFPKATTRNLTEDELGKLKGTVIIVGNVVHHRF